MTSATVTTEQAEANKAYRARKYRRIAQQAINATTIATYKAIGDDGQDCRITIKRAMRSLGYKSGYERVVKYWVFMQQDGEPFHAFSMLQRPYDKWMRDYITSEPRWSLA